ncbi:FxSxx-COOH system tetratricopeptide repeat protein [Streptomyces sp. TRM 70361]|uniref:FxSxx-COOH system tetratricopeptide repeat protein n=1 Tax=Streptomyces sp. TRM 70361 TaxID=3116553 RepID=UPI002E7AFFF2|nr:FxSxx-COOH system tetratricopeptide repeat protein [Streptomyces sp. TRM 70361]MEE1938810.1 FxSxx-COOH system tetratricopeptide repeat protein [Streptomyces sp. TRM 70361]
MGAQRHPAQSGAPGQGAEHVLVAFPGRHRSWAVWIANRLEAHGHRVTVHRWDPPREQKLEHALGDLLLARGRVLLVLSEWFFQLGPRQEGEWSEVLRGFVAANADRFAAVNLTSRPLLPATAVLEPADLWDVGEYEAERRLLARLSLTPAAAPPVPGGSSGTRYPNDQPAVWGEVPRRNNRFTGRDEILSELQQRLMDAERGTAACALVGTSGVGKTQIAAEYAHRFSSDYDVVWWVDSGRRGTQRDRLGELAVELGLSVGSEPTGRISAVREALRRGEPHGRWLLVFDGWEDVEDAARLLPRGGSGHVLVTARSHGWREVMDMLEVPVFGRAESTGYLLRRAPHISAEEADEVAAEFEDMPIQLAHAAAWLGESHMRVPEYLRRVRSGELSPLDQAAGPGEYPRHLLTSWSMVLNRLRQRDPRALELLMLCTSFTAGRIPLGLVRSLPASHLPERLRWIATDLPGWSRALEALADYSILVRGERSLPASAAEAPGRQQESVHMHGMVHSIVSRLTAGDDLGAYREVVRRVLAEADPADPADSRQWPRYAELLPHLDHAGVLESTEPRLQGLVLNCLLYCLNSGEYLVGIELAERIRERWSRLLAPEAQPMFELTTWQTTILRAHGRFQEAYELDRRALERLRAAEHPDEVTLMRTTNSLASDHRFLGRYAEALQLQREAVDMARRLLGPQEWTTLRNRHHLGASLRLSGRYHEAYEADRETLAQCEAVLRARHTTTLHSGTACARDLRLMGHYQEALARQEHVLRLHVQVLGEQHPQTLWARHNHILCLRRAGTDQHDIGAMLAALLEQRERVSGRNHYNTLALLTDYGNYLREHGDLSEAHDLIGEAEDGYRALVGRAHPVPTAMQSNAGLVMQAEGDRSGALNLFEQALIGLRTLLGDDHPVTLGCALNTTGGRSFTGRLHGAAELGRDTLGRARRVMGEDHPLTLSCMVALAWDLRSLGEREEASRVEEEALHRLTRTLGAQHPHTLSARQRRRPYWDYEPFLG